MVQLAKAAGCKVIASAGMEQKLAFLDSIGADVTFNYKTQDTLEVLLKEGPINMYASHRLLLQGTDVIRGRYWDNVGGEVLDMALEAAASHARFIVGLLPP